MVDTPSGPSPLPPAPDFYAQRAKWEARTAHRGPEAAIFHVKHHPSHYAELTQVQGDLVLPAVEAAVKDTPPRQILDFGCGWGRWTPILAERFGARIVGVDLTPTLVQYAMDHRRHPNVAYWHMRDRIPGPPYPWVDLIWSWTVCSAITDDRMLEVVFQEWRRVLARDGVVALLDNTSRVNGTAVRTPDSVSRTVEEYQAMLPWLTLTPSVRFVDRNEVNTLMIGRRR